MTKEPTPIPVGRVKPEPPPAPPPKHRGILEDLRNVLLEEGRRVPEAVRRAEAWERLASALQRQAQPPTKEKCPKPT